MKRIIHYKAGTYLPVSENWIYSQINGLKKFTPIVYCQNTENLETFSIKHIRGVFVNLNQLNIFNINLQINIIPILLKIDKPALIHAHFGPSGYSILKYKKLFNIPLITTFYGYDVNMLPLNSLEWRNRYKELFEFGDCFLTEGTNMKKSLIKLGCPADKIIVQHLGTDLNSIKFQPRVLKKGETIKVLISGRFTEKKGIPYALEALGKLRKKNPGQKLSITIIGDSGGDKNGEAEKIKILDTIKKHELSDITKMLGMQPYSVLIKEFYNHHIFLSPSVMAKNGDSEGGAPVSIIEASASGMPVVSTTHCDIPEVIINNVNGYLVDERDSDALAEKLALLIKNNNKWPDMGAKGRRHIEKNYDLNKQIHSLEEIYLKIINS